MTELFNAVIQDNFERVKYLVENGANIDELSFTASSARGNFDIVKFLAFMLLKRMH